MHQEKVGEPMKKRIKVAALLLTLGMLFVAFACGKKELPKESLVKTVTIGGTDMEYLRFGNEQGEKLLHYLAEAVRDNIAPQQFMQQAVEGVLREVQSNEVLLREQCVSFIDEQIDNLVQHPVRQAKLDKWIKTILFQVISKYHHIIPETIQARLDEFSDEELVEFVEGHIADDIQMIRINGAMVGSLVGMGLYALIYVAERMWQ